MKTKLLECCFERAVPRGGEPSSLLDRVNLGAVFSVMLSYTPVELDFFFQALQAVLQPSLSLRCRRIVFQPLTLNPFQWAKSIHQSGAEEALFQVFKLEKLFDLPQEEERKEASELLRGQSPYLFSASHRVLVLKHASLGSSIL
ncbi:hypothetical protein VNO80_33848 [Phaseolus coccineus]|uniref:Uncharacterized protein n=1 Tax=Phaseolus coccineus TaxID=3886 RepID=A0AAN9KZ82_PHACN